MWCSELGGATHGVGGCVVACAYIEIAAASMTTASAVSPIAIRVRARCGVTTRARRIDCTAHAATTMATMVGISMSIVASANNDFAITVQAPPAADTSAIAASHSARAGACDRIARTGGSGIDPRNGAAPFTRCTLARLRDAN